MPDFTLHTFRRLLEALKEQHYTFQPFVEFIKDPAPRSVILRHDVDARKLNALQTAQLESSMGIRGTYYFRIVNQSFDPEVIKQIHALGHEIGYHYEDIALAAKAIKRREIQSSNQPFNQSTHDAQLYDVAIRLFEQHLAKLRQLVPIETICMHGSPLSKYDNRKIWEQYDYRNYSIIGEPYFDVDFTKVLYLTDTGRRWDGEKVSLRDKVIDNSTKDTNGKRNNVPLRRACPDSSGGQGEDPKKPSFHSTFDIIHAARNNRLPNHIMLTLHPQRWNNRALPWIIEHIYQNIKNIGKWIMVVGKEDRRSKI